MIYLIIINSYFSNTLYCFPILVDDASGHYASGFFYGNNYWMGSMSLCKSIYHNDDEDELMRREKAKNSGLPFAKAHLQSYSSVYNENPPFVPGFYIIKMFLNETYPTNVVSNNYLPIKYF